MNKLSISEQRAWSAFIGSGIAGNMFLFYSILLPAYQKIKHLFGGK